ncbi:MAG TPA: ribosomal protein S18-alanine N-acetyltransferase [Dehalococcoidia bacterium]|nr:ribosomal protein S18-alanine N-acetyltransferase [Dehalococcoidia bacterium]
MSYYIVRQMQDRDIDQVTRIDREAFPNDWPPTPYGRELGNRLSYYIVVCEESEAGEKASPAADSPRPVELGPTSPLGRFTSGVRRLLRPENPSPPQMPDSRPVVGFAGIWVMLDEAHLSVIAVKQSHRRQGLGELLLISAIRKAMELNAKMVTLEVRVSNLGAQALYEKFGFRRVGIRRAYYADNREDAILMSADDITSAPFNAHLQRLARENAHKLASRQAQVVTEL